MNQSQVLFATDFSDRDLIAFKASCKLALEWNSKLHILHVLDPQDTLKPVDLQVKPEQEFSRFSPDDFEIDFVHKLRIGNAAEEILRYADQKNIGLIVLGTHGREGVERFFVGSVAESVMRKATCPVMTQKVNQVASARRTKTPRILVPIDFSVYGYAAVDFASQMALATSAELTICHVTAANSTIAGNVENDDSKSHRETAENQLKRFQPTSSKVLCSHQLFAGNPGEVICNFANENPFDFVVIGTHGRSGLNRAIMGSVAEYVVRHCNCPVISVKPTNKRAHVVV